MLVSPQMALIVQPSFTLLIFMFSFKYWIATSLMSTAVMSTDFSLAITNGKGPTPANMSSISSPSLTRSATLFLSVARRGEKYTFLTSSFNRVPCSLWIVTGLSSPASNSRSLTLVTPLTLLFFIYIVRRLVKASNASPISFLWI